MLIEALSPPTMEKVTVYGHVRPGRGERLPRVDFTESSRIDSPPPLAPQQARRRSTRLLPNLRYLPSYDEDCNEEDRTAVDEGIRPPRRQSCQAYEDLGAQQGHFQSRKSLASRNGRFEDPLGTSSIGRGSSRELRATIPRISTSTALSEKVAASRAISRSYNTMSTATKTKPQKLLQKPSVATLPRPKHKKALTGGRQIKTHLRCEHLLPGPVWGGGAPSVQQEQHSVNNLTKLMALERHRISRKIDALCAASASRGTDPGTGIKGGYDAGKGKRGRDVGEEGSPPAAKHSKLVASGRQYQTHLNYQQPPDQRRLQARPATAATAKGHVGDGKFRDRQRRLVYSDDGTSDEDDECNKRRRSYTKIGDMESNRKRGVLKSNIKTPRKSCRNVYEEAGSHLSTQQARPRSEASKSDGAADADIYALPQRVNSYKKCDCLHKRSSCFSCSDCVYCRKDTYHSPRSRCNLCPDTSCSHISQDDVGTAPLPDHRPNAVDELCPVCHSESTSLRDGGRRRSSRGYYQNSCHFCGMVFGKRDVPVVSEDGDLLHRSCDHHNVSSRSGSRPCGDRPQRPGRTEPRGHHRGANADEKRAACGTGFEDQRPQASLWSEETTRRDREERSSAPEGGKRPPNPPPRDEAKGQHSPSDRAHSSCHGSGGGKSTIVQFSDYSDNTNDRTAKRASDAFESDERTYHENPIGNDVRDHCDGHSQRRSFVGAGILKNSERNVRGTYSDNLQQNVLVNVFHTRKLSDQLNNYRRQRSGGCARQVNPSSSTSRLDNLCHGDRLGSRKENLRPFLTRGTEKVVRVRRDPAHSLVLEDHL